MIISKQIKKLKLALYGLLLLLVISCEFQSSNTGNLRISISDISEKTIRPDTEHPEIVSYKVTGIRQSQKQESFTYNFSTTLFEMLDVLVGPWIIDVEGYDLNSNLVAKSDPIAVNIIANEDNVVNAILKYIRTSTGSFSISISAPSERTDIRKVIIDAYLPGTKTKAFDSLIISDFTIQNVSMVFSDNFVEIPSGIYDIEINFCNSEGRLVAPGYIESLYVYDGVVSEFEKTLDMSWFKKEAKDPVITVSTLNYYGNKIVTIISDTNEADIYYTLDGTTPTVESELYLSPLTISDNCTLKAFATKSKYKDSNVVSEFVELKTAMPVASFESGEFLNPIEVELSCSTDGATIYYTLDGSVPSNTNGNIYTTPILIQEDTVLKAVAKKQNTNSSDILEKEYIKKVYAIGEAGPAGGYIFYDCDADNTVDDPDGADNLLSTTCGWRYLEAAPADLRVVNGVSTVDESLSGYSLSTKVYAFGYYRSSNYGINWYVNGSNLYSESYCTSSDIGMGSENMDKLVSCMKDSAYLYTSGSGITSEYAAQVCSVLNYGGFNDWYLPSKDELNLMYINLMSIGKGAFSTSSYWSSSEYNVTTSYGEGTSAWSQNFSDGIQNYSKRQQKFYIRPCRAF